jgi:hypothetical protein
MDAGEWKICMRQLTTVRSAANFCSLVDDVLASALCLVLVFLF